jgi:hypothetical protein
MRMADLKVSLAQAVIRNARSSLDRRDRGAAIEHDRHELLDAGRLPFDLFDVHVHGSVSIHRMNARGAIIRVSR